MAAVLTPKSFSFPHYLLHDTGNITSYSRMGQRTPPKPSLPSISSLMEHVNKHSEKTPTRSPSIDQTRSVSGGSYGHQPPTPDRTSFGGSPRNGLPATPPLPGASSFDFPARASTGSGSPLLNGLTQSGYFAPSPTTTNPSSKPPKHSSYPPVPDSNHWHGSASPASSRRASNELPAIKEIANHRPQSAYPDPAVTVSYQGLAQQRPLPSNFPPIIPSPIQQPASLDPQMQAVQFHHHNPHYPMGTTPYPQSTDRYQCPTCSKAFSRPSSLKIHTYSHTGEKPFKCKYDGCGKYFSVRSNMKRHEKGCHGLETSSNGGDSPRAS